MHGRDTKNDISIYMIICLELFSTPCIHSCMCLILQFICYSVWSCFPLLHSCMHQVSLRERQLAERYYIKQYAREWVVSGTSNSAREQFLMEHPTFPKLINSMCLCVCICVAFCACIKECLPNIRERCSHDHDSPMRPFIVCG